LTGKKPSSTALCCSDEGNQVIKIIRKSQITIFLS
jgi:hypothetical protein